MITSKTKAWLSSVMVLIVTVLFFSACSSEADEGVKAPPSNLPQAQIITELQDYNNSLVVMSDSRKLKWFHWLFVALSDALGAFQGSVFGTFGAVVMGAHSSLSQYVTLTSKDLEQHNQVKKESFGAAYAICKEKVISSDYTIGNTFGFDSCSISVGILHNKVLDCVEDVELKSNQSVWLAKLSPKERQTLEDENFVSIYNLVSSEPPYILENVNTKADAVMQLFLEVVKEKCTSYETLKEIIDKYKKSVENSTELTAEEKQNLYIGFSVMAYSFNYWSIRWPYSEVD